MMNSAQDTGKGILRREIKILGLISLVALSVRISLMLYFQTHIFSLERNFWTFGFENGRIAKSIAEGNGFSSPFFVPTGPTAIEAPFYPYFLAVVFKICGIYSKRSAVLVFLFQSMVSALTCITVFYITKKIFSEIGVSYLCAIFLAIYPPSIWYSINWIWNTAFFTFLLTGIFLFFLHLPKSSNRVLAGLCGLFMGFTVLVNPTVLAFYPAALGWLIWKSSEKREGAKQVLLISLITFLTIVPWLVRNYIVFDKVIFKSNFGIALRIGNNPIATGGFKGSIYPSESMRELTLYTKMGEINYEDYCYNQAKSFIKEHPMIFLRLTMIRIYQFWLSDLTGDSFWSGNLKIAKAGLLKKLCYLLPFPFFIAGILFSCMKPDKISLIILLLVCFPLVCYVTQVQNRYHYPIEPFVLILASYGLYSLIRVPTKNLEMELVQVRKSKHP